MPRRGWPAARILLLGGAAALALGARPADARAQENAPGEAARREQAAELVDQGTERYQAGDYEGALERFDQAYRAYPSPKIFLNQGGALRKLGRRAEAAQAYHRFLTETDFSGLSADKVRLARQALGELEVALGRVRLEVRPPAAAAAVDGRPAGVPLDRPIFVEPGKHLIRVSASGYVDRELSVEVAALEELHVPLTLERARAGSGSGRSRPWAWTTAATAGVLLAAGIGVGLHVDSLYDEYKSTTSQQRYFDLRDQISTETTVTNVLFVGAGVAAVGAGLLFYFEGRSSGRAPAPSDERRLGLRPGPGAVGLALAGRF